MEDQGIKAALPSLYLNVAKSFEDVNDPINAKANYDPAKFYCPFLPDDKYGNMFKRPSMRKSRSSTCLPENTKFDL